MLEMAEALQDSLTLPHLPIQKVIVALSGGCDSTSLLHFAKYADLPYPIEAWHVNHGLQPDANQWEETCQDFCHVHGIPLRVFRLQLSPKRGESLEVIARDGRYGAFEQAMPKAGVLLFGHTQEDQSETILLRLLRGAGPKGLSGMPAMRKLGKGVLLRPWLQISKQTIHQYAQTQKLSWIEDPSNAVLDFDRNFLRHEIMPPLQRRFPGMHKSLSRSAIHCYQADRLLGQMASEDFQLCASVNDNTLIVEEMKKLSAERCNHLLRYWFDKQGISLPSTKKLADIKRQMLFAQPDKNPCVNWPGGGRVRRYQGVLVLEKLAPDLSKSVEPKGCVKWNYAEPLTLWCGKQLKAVQTFGKGISIKVLQEKGGALTVSYRKGGELCRPAGRGCTRPLKKLLQEHKVPVWERSQIPLIYCENELIAVPGILIQEGWQASELSEVGLELFLDF